MNVNKFKLVVSKVIGSLGAKAMLLIISLLFFASCGNVESVAFTPEKIEFNKRLDFHKVVVAQENEEYKQLQEELTRSYFANVKGLSREVIVPLLRDYLQSQRFNAKYYLRAKSKRQINFNKKNINQIRLRFM